ncbi:MAG TPA: glycosyltransferase family 2 protein [Puia sp.]|jgi:GT2 family glycosyltransferase|nr:glycosyltransferase family 2 protein [Puia sp.]
MKPLSFVIITYNRPEDMLELALNISRLEGIEKWVEEVIIVNNRSSESYAPVEAYIAAHPEIPFRYVVAPENLGVSRGRNYAVRLSRAPILVFIDDDAMVRNDDALPAIAAIFEADPAIGIAAFRIYYHSTGELQVNAFPHKRFDERKDWHAFDTAYFSGAAHAIRRSVFEHAGFYPESFFYGMEEYDLSYRAIDKGYTIRYDDRVRIWHKESPGGRLPPRVKLRGMWVNKSKVAWKYLPGRYFISTAFLWSLEYLKKSGWDIGGFAKGWQEVLHIPRTEKKAPLTAASLAYLRRVQARLWY